jgi:hypothetical protein
MIGGGQLPLWTPLLFSGYPLVAITQLGLGYPLTWLHLLVPGHVAEQIYVLAPFVITPITTFAYLRTIGRSYLASIFGGLTFAFGGMMCSILANSGLLTNTFAWTPLVLVFVERARTRTFAYCVTWTSLSYGLAVLSGHTQAYVYVGVLLVAYGLFTSISVGVVHKRSWTTWSTWRPLVVSISSLIFAAGLAALQLFEVMRVAKRSIRSELRYEVFSEGSFSFREALLSLGAPIYHYIDSGTYLTPLAIVMALITVFAIVRRWIKDERVWFWIIVAGAAWILLLGSNAPLHKLVYQIPVIKNFRVPSRHTFEWTLAIAVLGAYGWDLVAEYFRRRRERLSSRTSIRPTAAVLLIIAAAVVGVLFWKAVSQMPNPHPWIYTGLPEQSYWRWKLFLTALIFSAAVFSFLTPQRKLRVVCLSLVIGLACFVEANATVNSWWAGLLSLPAERFHVVSKSTRYLQQFAPEQHRVYSRVAMFSDEFTTEPRVDSTNLSMLWKLQNVAGIEPLILERYSRALGDVGPDSVTARPGMVAKDDLFLPHSHVLDILNATHAITYSGSLGLYEEVVSYHDRVRLSVGELNSSLLPGQTRDFGNRLPLGDELALVTSLSNSVTESDDAPVARITFYTADGRTINRDLLAGSHTAEWAHERPDVRAAIKHRLATVFDQRPGDGDNTFASYRYWALLKIDKPERIERVQITNLSKTATLSIWKMSMVNTSDMQSSPLWIARSPAWTTAFEDRGLEVLNNTGAMPRVWLVTHAEAVDGEEALRRIRGESTTPFEPRKSVLLEVRPDELPQLSGADSASGVANLIEHKPTRLSIETDAPTNTVLVVSEIFYPGWRVTVDGQPARIMLADFLLRAVSLPPGKHKVEMYYSPTPAYVGAGVSIVTLILLSILALYGRRKQQQSKRSES